MGWRRGRVLGVLALVALTAACANHQKESGQEVVDRMEARASLAKGQGKAVSDAFEKFPRIPIVRDGVPLLGMEKFVRQDPALVALLGDRWIQAPNTEPVGSPSASGARHHGDFDSDAATLRATLSRILAGDAAGAARASAATFRRNAPASALRSRRQAVDTASRMAP